MLREKLVDKKHLETIRGHAFKLQERIERGGIDAEKTAEGVYKSSLNGRIIAEFVGLFSIFLSLFMFGAVRYGVTTQTTMFNIMVSASLGVFLLILGVLLLIKDVPNLAAPLEVRLVFKSSEEEKGTKEIE